MTEEEAKTKWCPMARVNYTVEDSKWQGEALTNRGDFLKAGPPDMLCLASGCMMWEGDSCGLVFNGSGINVHCRSC